MFDNKSDYARNKRQKDAIVYSIVTGIDVLLTCEDFSSEDEFLRWKAWSDEDYMTTEREGRGFYDNCFTLDERIDGMGTVPSAENILFDKYVSAERARVHTALMQKVRGALTPKQYRRLWLYYVEGLSECDIAKMEQVGQQRVSKSIKTGIKALQKAAEC